MAKALPLLLIGAAFLLMRKKGGGTGDGTGTGNGTEDGTGDGNGADDGNGDDDGNGADDGNGTDDGNGNGAGTGPGGLAPGPDTDPGPGTGPGGPGGLAPGTDPDPDPGTDYPPVTPTPTPGSSYRIAFGDTLFAITGLAYGVGSGGTRLSLSKQVNTHPINVANGVYIQPGGNEGSWYPAPLGRLSFNPPYQLIYFPVIPGY